MLAWPFKDPDERLDFTLEWSARLGSDIITASTWDIVGDSELVVESDEFSISSTTIWLSGGTLSDPAAEYILTNRIDTLGGRIMDQSVKLKIKTK